MRGIVQGPLRATGTFRFSSTVSRVKMPRILKARRQTIRTMTISDAAAQLDGGEGVVLFLDAETERIAVVYRAPGGDLTLIETKP